MKKTRSRSQVPDLAPFYRGGPLLPTREGVYLAYGVWGDLKPQEIDVYRHPIKGLSCFADDFGSGGTDVNDKYDCHVSVQMTGLDFIRRVRDLR